MNDIMTYLSTGFRFVIGVVVLVALLFLFFWVGIIALGVAVVGGLIAWLFGRRHIRQAPPQKRADDGNGIIIDHE